jgi:hypothetical protein
VRSALTTNAKAWRNLTQAQIAAWNTEAASMSTSPENGTSGKMTGLQLFVQQNCVLALTGQPATTAPLASASFAGLGTLALNITNTGGTIKIVFTATGTQPAYALVRACPPQSAGVSICSNWRILGLLPTPTSGAIDITSLFVAKFGAPAVGKKLFIQVGEVVGGTEAIPSQFEAVVPATG